MGGGFQEDRDAEDYELIELYDSDVELRHFVDAGGKSPVLATRVHDDELCYTLPSSELDPFQCEHEGYMGNWGNTVERWYHRAAVVLWPRARTFVLRARGSAIWAVREIGRSLRAGNVTEAVAQVEQVLPFWERVARAEGGARLAGQTLRVAAGLPRADLAARLAERLEFEHLSPTAGSLLATAVQRHGLSFGRELVEGWGGSSRTSWSRDRPAWLATLRAVVEALCGSGDEESREVARALCMAQWAWLEPTYATVLREPPSRRSAAFAELDGGALGLLGAALACDDAVLFDALRAFLANGPLPPLAQLSLLKRALRGSSRSEVRRLRLGALHRGCVAAVASRLAAPVRRPGDWSLPAVEDCDCALCSELGGFLADARAERLEWPLAKLKRRHLHNIIEKHELPLRHQTTRRGSPYTLVLQKTRALLAREKKERVALRGARSWLARHARAFADA